MRVIWEENLFHAFTPAAQVILPRFPPTDKCRSPPSSSSEAADPVVLADATDVSHLGYLGSATARKVIPFVARTAAKRQSVQLERSPFESPQSCFSYHQSRINLTGAFHMVLDECQKSFGNSCRAVREDTTQAWPYLTEGLTKFQLEVSYIKTRKQEMYKRCTCLYMKDQSTALAANTVSAKSTLKK
ncbi:unnamed protein product [Musa acuminata var. zebrina]